MLWEHEPQATKKKKNSLFTSIIKMWILFVRAIITSTARASSVFLSSYRNTVLNQSACVFALGYSLNIFNKNNINKYHTLTTPCVVLKPSSLFEVKLIPDFTF